VYFEGEPLASISKDFFILSRYHSAFTQEFGKPKNWNRENATDIINLWRKMFLKLSEIKFCRKKYKGKIIGADFGRKIALLPIPLFNLKRLPCLAFVGDQ
jgi:hypothetical protein